MDPAVAAGQPQALSPAHISIRHHELCHTNESMNTSVVKIPYKSGALVDFCENTVKMVKYNEYIEQIHILTSFHEIGSLITCATLRMLRQFS